MKPKPKQLNPASVFAVLVDDGYLELNKKDLSDNEDMIVMNGFWHKSRPKTIELMILILLKQTNTAYLIPQIVWNGKNDLNLLNLDALKQYQIESDPLNENDALDYLKMAVAVARGAGDVGKSAFLPMREKRNGIISYVAKQPVDFWAKLRRMVGRVKVA